MKDKPILAILQVIGASILGAAGQFLFKAGSATPDMNLTTLLKSLLIIGEHGCPNRHWPFALEMFNVSGTRPWRTSRPTPLASAMASPVPPLGAGM